MLSMDFIKTLHTHCDVKTSRHRQSLEVMRILRHFKICTAVHDKGTAHYYGTAHFYEKLLQLLPEKMESRWQ